VVGGEPESPRVVIVTGGSRGIGAATCRLAAAAGYRVCVAYRADAAAAQTVVQGIVAAGGVAIAVQADVSRTTDVDRLFATVDRELGTLSALVNNAGVIARQTRVDEMDEGRINQILAVNVTGTLLCAKQAVRRMSTAHGGRGGVIVNVSSAAARLGGPGEYVDYAASKAAVDTVTLGLAREVAAENVRVNAVRPGIVRTEIHASGGDPGRVDRLESSIPMRRAGEPGEIAEAILWLMSDAASYVTGSILDVTGGR
jgi:NAD(P)-dependent dehydrogenase (short-subunit alcohol dehydrogenase family)